MDKFIHILLVEDNEDHIALVQKTLRKERIANSIDAARNAEDALLYLRKEGAYADKPLPDVILLDLNLPGMNGLELLQKIKEEDLFREIPVVILTTSDAEADKLRAYRLNANSYVTKPLRCDSFRTMIKDLGLYWTVWNEPPYRTGSE